MAVAAVKECPILMNGEMVRAVLANRKTQTRRLLKPSKRKDGCELVPELLQRTGVGKACPIGAVGDRLWVRETLKQKANGDYSNSPHSSQTDWVYAADGEMLKPNWAEMVGWSVHRSKPSIHMPRWASRITLEIVCVRVERLNDISEADADAEGFGGDFPHAAFPEFDWTVEAKMGAKTIPECFAELWESINGEGSWAANPWVWVIEFKRVI